jgi:hypothetical protein
MNYRALVPKPVKDQIASWGLPRPLVLAIYTRLHGELAADPDQHLRDRVVPLAAFAYRFTLEDKGPIPRLHHFFFAVDRRDDLGELRILGGSHDTDAPEEN